VYDKRPNAGQEYYLRKLLMSVKGVRSYRGLATVGDVVHLQPSGADQRPADTVDGAAARAAAAGPLHSFDPIADVLHVPSDVYDFKAAAIAMGIVSSDHEQRDAMHEAVDSGIMTPAGLRSLFVTLLIDCECESVDTAEALFEAFWRDMAADYTHITTAQRNVVPDSDDVARCRALCALRDIAARSHRTLDQLGLPSPAHNLPTHASLDGDNDSGAQYAPGVGGGGASGHHSGSGRGGVGPVLRRSPEEYRALADDLESKVRTVRDQEAVYDAVMGAVHANTGACFFVDAPAGRGKTFVLNALLARVRGHGWGAAATASTAIVALTLDGGTTCHKGFGLPVNVSYDTLPDTVSSTLKADCAQAQLLATARLIVLDEITMLAGVQLHVIDNLLRMLRSTCVWDVRVCRCYFF
jgi:hypothetical protein